jgi:asparagine synthase (glutamine-hydrolysing)
VPGIAGIITKSRPNNYHAEHASMIEAMENEPFYTSGLYSEARLNMRLGWVVQSNSFCDCMPVVNERQDLVLIFSGEDFARNSTRRRLGAESRSGFQDARYLIRLYEEMGESFLAELNGWFTGVLADLNQRKIMLFNDRYGMQRLYYYESADAFFFASEAKSLLHVLPAARNLSPEAFGEHVAFGCVLGERSLFEGVSTMPGGSCWTFDQSGQHRKARYFEPETLESRVPIREHELVENIRSTFIDILPRYFESSENVALSLTGGLDMRLIVAGADSAVEGLPSYTFAGARDTFDVRQSWKVARAVGLKHQVLRLGADFFDNFANLAEETVYRSDGALGTSRTHDLYFNRLARNIAHVRLTGLFGSEVLRQRRILPPAARVDGLLTADFMKHVEEAEQCGDAYRRGHPLTAALHRDIPWKGQGVRSIEQSQLTVRAPFTDNDFVELMYTVPHSARSSAKVQLSVIEALNGHLAGIMSDHGHSAKWNPITRRIVRAFIWSLFKADYIYFFDTPNWMLKYEPAMHFLKVPQLLLGYHKFEQYSRWYRDALSDYLADILLDRRTLERPFFNRNFLRRAVDEHLSGKRNYHNQLDKALTLELIMRTLIESRAYAPSTRRIAAGTGRPDPVLKSRGL